MSYSRSLTLDYTQAGASDTSNYPCLFTGNASLATVANGGRVTSSTGYDIVFCTNPASPLTSLLNFERVWWNATTGLGEFWIQIPTLSHTANTVVYVYYGDATITTDKQNVNATWDSSFSAVYHFGSPSTLVASDSTSNANNGTSHGATAGAGQIGGAAQLASASSQYLDMGAGGSVNAPVSIECWWMQNSTATSAAISTRVGADGYVLLPTVLSSGPLVDFANSGVEGFQYAAPSPSLLIPNYMAGVCQSAAPPLLYLNATPNTGGPSGACPSSWTGGGGNLTIGAYPSGGGNYMNGWVDEVRLSSVARSADYILATFNNTKTSSTFVAVGSETLIGGGGGGSLLVNCGMQGGMRPQMNGGMNGYRKQKGSSLWLNSRV